ncbi:MAG TPA: CDP-alcohol phosphatidyltransferase family protein [Candidatus Hydrogenedentes bacterium]|nr:CDP-alcohol phosphatidyltransferase family protein [Candidatus Hydrogenedentota bacterium]HPG66672.1 CDP-alcohol phosphatidyltransferase family protein [Candidatus Hydrogenedentota bacterium]
MTLANRITLIRLSFIPVFLACIAGYGPDRVWLRHAALVLYLTAAVSDCVDGYIARNYNQQSRLGRVLDPLADKLMINLAFVFLAVNDHFATHVPYWFPPLVLGRDVTIVIGSFVIHEYFGTLSVRPRLSGKATAVFQYASVVAVLLEVPFARGLILATAALTVVSLVDYIYAGCRQVGVKDPA